MKPMSRNFYPMPREELEARLEEAYRDNEALRDRYSILRDRVIELEDALAFYSDPSSYKAKNQSIHGEIYVKASPVDQDKGDIARTVLSNWRRDNDGIAY